MKSDYYCMPWIKELIKTANINELKKVFFKKIYFSFFILEPKNKIDFAKKLLDDDYIKNINLSILRDLLNEEIPDELLLDVSDLSLINKSFLFPFIQSRRKIYYWYNWDNVWVKNILDLFLTDIFSYVSIIPFENKLIVFTDLKEEKILPILSSLNDFRALELHLVIPKIIDNLKWKIGLNNEKWVNELWIGFPLSMLWWHADIRDKIKKWWAISGDKNFRNLIMYGLLNFLKLKLDYTISFNKDNEKNKFNLHGYLYNFKENTLNQDLIYNLKSFLNDIDDNSSPLSNDFFGLPIYIISWKYVYKKSEWYPIFDYTLKTKELFLRLVWDSSETFRINWFFPQYIKITEDNDFAYLRVRDDIIKDKINDYWFEDSYFSENKQSENCEAFLNEIRYNMTSVYHYVSDDELSSLDNSLEFRVSDLFLSATSDKQDYIINISNPKKHRNKDDHSLTVNIYKLSSFGYWWDNIQKSIVRLNNSNILTSNFIGSIEIDLDRKTPTTVKYNGNQETVNCIVKYKASNWNWDIKPPTWKFWKPSQFSDQKAFWYIDDNLKYEDYLSLCLIKLFEFNNHKAFFWWKKDGRYFRELADIISVSKKGDILDLNLFHIKTKPFEQIQTSNLEASFAEYTQVVWQTLEKVKSFMDEKDIGWILNWLEHYFQYSFKNNKTSTCYDHKESEDALITKNAPNYCVYEEIKTELLNHKNWTINFNIYFPVRHQDYFLDPNQWDVLKNLALETNWKRLKMVSDIFNSNVTNVNNASMPNLKIQLNLWILVLKPQTKGRSTKSNIHLVQMSDLMA